MAHCGNCGTQLSKGAKFCPNCGQSVSETENSNASKPKVSKPKASKSRVSKSKTREPRRNNAKKASRANIVNSDLSSSMKSGLGIAIIIAGIVFLASISNGLFIVSLVSVCAITACVLCFKEIIEQKYVWWVVAGSIIIPLLAMVISLSPDKPKKFEALKNGRAAYKLIETHYENSDVKSINKIVMYNGNGRQDCKAEGVNGQGQLYAVDGKWEKKEISSSYDICYYRLDFKYFQLNIHQDSTVDYSKGDKKYEGKIGKIKDLSQEEENLISEKFSKEMKKQEERTKPLRGSKDADFVKKRIAYGSIWTYTQRYGNPIGWWFRLKFDKSKCEVYDALPADGEWTFRYQTPYYVEEKRLDDGKRYVFVCLRYIKNSDGSMEEPIYPLKINITQGSFIYGASGAIGFINEQDYKWE